MQYERKVKLKDGRNCLIRNADDKDALAMLNMYVQTHNETCFLLAYGDERTFTEEQEAGFLKIMAESDRDVQLMAFVDGEPSGCASLTSLGNKIKIRHRSELGMSILKEYWNLGIGSQLMKAIIECALKAGIEQIELEVVSDNTSAVVLYKKFGFKECGRNPKGFKKRTGEYQELISMRKELKTDR